VSVSVRNAVSVTVLMTTKVVREVVWTVDRGLGQEEAESVRVETEAGKIDVTVEPDRVRVEIEADWVDITVDAGRMDVTVRPG